MTSFAPGLRRPVSLAVVALSCAGCLPFGDEPREPEPTPGAILTGVATSATIGPEGGILTSDDGAVSLVVPSGALASSTTLTIQPALNLAHGGLGSAYAIGPDGTTFATPATVRFRVETGALARISGEGLGVAYQDAEGYWRWVDATTYDATEGTLSAETTHLTVWSMVAGLRLLPLSANVLEGESAALSVVSCYDPDPGGGDPLASLIGFACDDDDALAPLVTASEWSVNGVLGGNATYGTVAATGAGPSARFQAPGTRPSPPTVVATVRVAEALGGRPNVTLYSHLTIGAPRDLAGTVTIDAETMGTTFRVEETVTLTVRDDGPDETNYSATGTAHLATTSFILGDATCSADEASQAISEDYYLKIRKEPELAVRLGRTTAWPFTCVAPGGTFAWSVQVSFMTATGTGCITFDDVPITDIDAPSGSYRSTCNPLGPATATWTLHATE